MVPNSSWIVETLIEGGALQATVSLVTNAEECILVDTGYPRQQKRLLESLERRGLSADSITHVFNTHLHFDHSHNNSVFRRAKIVCARREFEWMTELCDRLVLDSVSLDDVYKCYPELRPFEDDPKTIWGMLKMVQRIWSQERLGRREQFLWLEDCTLPDGMEALPTPGHVPFHYSYVFGTASGPTLIAGDAMITRSNADQKVMTFPPTNRQQYAETKKALEAFEGTIVPGHDLQFRHETREIEASSVDERSRRSDFHD